MVFQGYKDNQAGYIAAQGGAQFCANNNCKRSSNGRTYLSVFIIVWHGIFEMIRGHGYCMNKSQTTHIHTHISIPFLVVLVQPKNSTATTGLLGVSNQLGSVSFISPFCG